MDDNLEREFRDAKTSVWASAKHLRVAPQLIRAVSKYEKDFGVDRAQKAVERLYDREQFIFSRVDSKLISGAESDKVDHWFDELDEVMRYVGLEPKYMMIESRHDRAHLIKSAPSPEGYAGGLHEQRRHWEKNLRTNPTFRPTDEQMYDFAQKFDMQFPSQHIPAAWFSAASEPMKRLLNDISILVKEGGELNDAEDPTGIYTTFEHMRLADSREEKELCDAVMSGLNKKGFQNVHTLLAKMIRWHQNNAYTKQLLGHMLDVAEHAHLELIKEDVTAWLKAMSQDHRRTPEIKKQITYIRNLIQQAVYE